MTTNFPIVVYSVIFILLITIFYHWSKDKPPPEKLAQYFDNYLKKTKKDWNYLTAPQLYQILRYKNSKIKPEDIFLLDVRKPRDYQKSHIPNSTNIFWLNLMESKNIQKLPKDKIIVIICYVGHTASQILVLLKLLGYQVYVLKYGLGVSPTPRTQPIKGWINYRYPTISD